MRVQCLWRTDAELGESPMWLAEEGALYFLDILRPRLFRYTLGADMRTIWPLPMQASALVPLERGGLALLANEGLFKFDRKTGSLKRLHELTLNDAVRTNDAACDDFGNLWFGTMDKSENSPTGEFFRLTPKGQLTRLHEKMVITNGPAFDRQSGQGYFVDTLNRSILSAPVSADGLVSDPAPFAEIPESQGYPDGLATDAENGVWCAQFAGGRLTRFHADGRHDHDVLLPVSNITKSAFGGAQMNTLFVTTARKGLTPPALDKEPQAGSLFAVTGAGAGLPPAAFADGSLK